MDVWAVVGAGYGDEGKGRVTDALSVGQKTCVVRYNGGAQAGHTVKVGDTRFVFHHVGAGSLAQARTHLSRFFVVNPMVFLQEWRQLRALGLDPDIGVDPRAPVTTPFEMMINQAVENRRAGRRHGSCGLGFGETWEREEKGPGVTMEAVFAEPGATLERLWEEWVPRRCAVLGLEPAALGFTKAIGARFIDDWQALARLVRLRRDDQIGQGVARVVFEGAQGLGLDQDLGYFPHVTRSNTGMKNVALLAKEAGLSAGRSVYVTRSYATRHGAGPLEGEAAWVGAVPLDETNKPNAWQGALRAAPIDEAVLRDRIAQDRVEGWEPGLAVTWCDAVLPRPVMSPGVVSEAVAPHLAACVDIPLWMQGYGPDRADLRVVFA